MKPRHKNDLYETNRKLTLELLKHVKMEGLVLEPTAGKLAIVKPLKETGHQVVSNELYPSEDVEVDYQMDARLPELYNLVCPDWIVANPPFTYATEILQYSLETVSTGVAFLLRQSFNEPTKDRFKLLEKYQCWQSHEIIFNPRPRFRTDTKGSDSNTVCWLVWDFRQQQEGVKKIYAHGWNK